MLRGGAVITGVPAIRGSMLMREHEVVIKVGEQLVNYRLGDIVNLEPA